MILPMLTVSNLAVQRGKKRLLANLNCELPKGSSLGVVGPNGVGKSSLLRVLAGLDNPASGDVAVKGTVAYLPQDVNLKSDLNVLEMVLLGRARYLKWYQQPNFLDRTEAEKWLQVMSLENLAKSSFITLSGGQKQLVLIAQALTSECDLLILDEPSSALDLQNQEKLFSILNELREKNALTIIFSTHDPNQAYQFCDQLTMLGFGHHQHGRCRDVMNSQSLKEIYKVNFEEIEWSNNDLKYFLHITNNVIDSLNR